MDDQNAFLAGTVAMFEGSAYPYLDAPAAINFNIGYAPLPTYKTNKRHQRRQYRDLQKRRPQKEKAA